jgi:multidrug efflux pump
MRNPVDYAISHSRLTLSVLLFLLVAGLVAYIAIPKEAEPDVSIPIVYVNVTQRGISPEDAERLILRPLETSLKSVSNMKEMRSSAFEGGGYVLLEFEAGFDSDVALADVRAKVDDARADLPADADEPHVQEVNLSLFPVLVVALGGDVPERTLLQLARQAETAIEQVPGVLSAELRGARDEAVEIIAEPMLMKSYDIALDDLVRSFSAGNSLVAAGALEGASGRFAVKVPSLIETPEDILRFPVAVSGDAAVTLGDIAEVRPTFKDPTSITRVNGKPAIAIEVSKRTGANLIDTVDYTRAVVEELRKTWPGAVEVAFTQDKSKDIRTMLHELQNSVITAVLLVVVIMLVVLGFRASLFIGIAIPASFLAGILGLYLAGLTVNIVVLFSLILAVGMLVDDAIIVSEFAERRMSEGMEPRQAYSMAAKRMAGPVIAATATRVAAFSPLLFWPGIVGEFMKYMPITLIATLSASLAVALFFTPTLGAILGRAHQGVAESICATAASICAPSSSRSPVRSPRSASRRRSSSASSRPTAPSATAWSSSPTSSPISASFRSAPAATSPSRRRTASFAPLRSASSAWRRSPPSTPAPVRASAAPTRSPRTRSAPSSSSSSIGSSAARRARFSTRSAPTPPISPASSWR